MVHPFCTPTTRVMLAGAAVAACLGVAAPAFSSSANNAPPPPGAAADPRKTHQALHELDRFLDHHPLLEDDLRLHPHLTRDTAYLRAHPELRDFLATNAGVVTALAEDPRHILRRALMLQATAPLRWSEIAQLDPFLDENPGLERNLAQHPEWIHDEKFLREHASLRDYLAAHPALAHVFLPASG